MVLKRLALKRFINLVGCMDWPSRLFQIRCGVWSLRFLCILAGGIFFVNALTLYFVGQMAEEIWGSHRFLLLYVFSGVMGNAFTMWLTPETVAAGASTSLFGLFAAIMVLGTFGNNQALRDLGKSYQTLIVVNLLLNLLMPNVSMAGHIGGVVGGALIGLGFSNNLQELRLTKSQKALALLAYGLALGVVLLLGFRS